MACPCGLPEDYDACCGMFHSGKANAPTAQRLMRSRYCAFVKQDIAYLKQTTWPAQQKHFDEAGYAARAANSIWLGLTVHAAEEGSETDIRGTVTFTAKSMVNGVIDDHTEKSLFKKRGGNWFYVKALS